MMTPRFTAALLTVTGILLCTVSDADRGRQPPVDSGFHVLAADFHVHAVFGDGGLAPWDARREAARRGLDVIAVTNHNQMWAARLHRWLYRSAPLPLVLKGAEVTAPSYHILAIGVSAPVRWNQPAAGTIADIHAAGGVAIAAHPRGDVADGYDPAALALLDGVERAHPGMHADGDTFDEFDTFFARARQHNPRVSPVGNSDFHFTGRIGLYQTYVLATDISEAGVLDALRNGRTVAYDMSDTPYGDPAFVAVAERARRARPAALPPLWAARANTAGVGMAWVGLAALVLLGPKAAGSAGLHG